MTPDRLGHVRDIITNEVRADPLTQALLHPIIQAVTAALDAHQPKLAYPTADAAAMLNVSASTVNRLVHDGRLRRVAGSSTAITLASILDVAEWPMQPAPLTAPLTVVPARGDVS